MNDYLVKHVRTFASDILEYPCVVVSPARSNVLALTHSFESCTTSVVYLEPYQTFMMKRLGKNDNQTKLLKNFF